MWYKSEWKNELNNERLFVLNKIDTLFDLVDKKNQIKLKGVFNSLSKQLFYLEKELKEWKK
jgi:hypothetical protein